ncbi:MAG: HAMP domain-containing histidine kinase [Spirochaetia bacterium]|nr:HAMP domain-containing histidine kinase [Spirochaetia bacterium]
MQINSQNLFDYSNDLIFAVNSSRKIINANKPALDFSGKKKRKELEKHLCYKALFSRKEPCDFCNIFDNNAASIKNNLNNSFEISIEEPDDPVGRLRYFNIKQHIVYDDENKPVVIEVISDITRYRQDEEEYARNSKLIALGTLIQSVAHELANPLTGLSLTLQNIEEKIDKEVSINSDYIKNKIRLLKTDLKKTSHIISDIKSFHTKETYEIDKIIIYETLRESIKEIKRIYKKKLKIQFKWRLGKDYQISGNKSKIIQVFINLFKNSLEAAEPESTVTVWLIGRMANDSKSEDDKKFLEVQYIDNAGGISGDIISRIFDPYFTTKKGKSGSGLGLFLVQKILFEHNAVIETDSRGKHTRFRLKFY